MSDYSKLKNSQIQVEELKEDGKLKTNQEGQGCQSTKEGMIEVNIFFRI